MNDLCAEGHDDWYYWPGGDQRMCRTCRRERRKGIRPGRLVDPDGSIRIADGVSVEGHGCHIWNGVIDSQGYGRIHLIGKGKTFVHRVAWENAKGGSVPDGLELDHLCRTRACCNVDHLEAVTHAENVRRGVPYRKPRQTVKEGRNNGTE